MNIVLKSDRHCSHELGTFKSKTWEACLEGSFLSSLSNSSCNFSSPAAASAASCFSETSRPLLVYFFPRCNTNLYIFVKFSLFRLFKEIRQFRFHAKLVKCFPIGYFYLHFALISGHGGARAAEYVKHNLFSNLIRHPKFISDTKSAIGILMYCEV